MTASRLVWVIIFPDRLDGASIFEITKAFAIGVRFDQIIILLALLPILLLFPWIKLKPFSYRLFLGSYFSIIYFTIILLLLADIRFYQYFDSHLNFLAVEYIGEGSLFFNLIVTDSYFYIIIFITLIAAIILVKFKLWLFNKLISIPCRYSWNNQIIYFLSFVILFSAGIRGRLNLAPMDWGIAYFSEHHFLNQLALNGIYTLGRNLSETNHDPRLSFMNENERFKFTPTAECLSEVQDILSQENIQWLNPDSSLLRKVIQPPLENNYSPNIIIVVMESWPARLTGTLGDNHNLTPYFDDIASEGILFPNFYANGIRTNYGLTATLCSFPSLPGRSIMKRYDAHHPFTSLSEILHQRGYYNCFIYGGDLAFDNMEGFFKEKKYDFFYGENNFGDADKFSKWGVPDHIMFEKITELTDSLPRPFQITTLTLSNHEPFDLPDSSVRKFYDNSDSSKIFNSQLYADYAIGTLIENMKQKSVFDSTIFVFVSDHCKIGNSPILTDPKYFHIPLLIYSPSLLGDSGIQINKYGSQIDILPTLMSLLGGNYDYQGWGRNLLELPEDDNGFAILSLWNRLSYLDDDFLYVENFGFSIQFYQNNSNNFKLIENTNDFLEDYLSCQNRLRRIAQIAEQLSIPTIPVK